MKCYMCGEETVYKSYLLKMARLKNIKENKDVHCLCENCENKIIEMAKESWGKENE